jgi:hypothetical protein
MSDTDSQNTTEQSSIAETIDTADHEYRCPHCSATYSNEWLTRVHITRADDEDHTNRNGRMPEEHIELVNEDGTVVKTLSRRPEEIDLTTVTVDDLPDELSPKRKHALIVATHNPDEDTRRRLTEMTEQRLSDSEYDVEPPAERTVGRALDEFYHPHIDEQGVAAESLDELAETQQAIVIAKLAQPNASIAELTDLVGCSETYTRQVTTNFSELIDRLETEVAEGKPLRAIIEQQLPNADITTLVEKNLLSELDGIDTDAIRNPSATEKETDTAATTSSTATDSDEINTPIEVEYDPDRWGSPVEQSTGLQASPDSPLESSNGTTTSPSDTERDNGNGDNSSEFEPVKIGGHTPEAGDRSDQLEQIPSREVEDLRRNVAFLRQAMETTDIEGAQLIVSVAQQVETHCEQLLQSHS